MTGSETATRRTARHASRLGDEPALARHRAPVHGRGRRAASRPCAGRAHAGAQLGAERLWHAARRRRARRGARRHDRRPGSADGEGRPEGDLPLRLAGRRRREPLRPDLSRSEPLPGRQRAGARPASEQRAHARDPGRGRRGQRGRLDAADPRRRRGRLRRPAPGLRADARDDRGRRRGRPLRGSARRGEEMRAPGRQGARARRASSSAR